MKKKALVMEVELTKEGRNGLGIEIQAGLVGKVADIASEGDIERLVPHINAISEILSDIIRKDFKKELVKYEEENVDEIKKSLYEKMSEDAKKEIDEYERELEKLETDEERAEYAFKKVMEELSKLENLMGDYK